METKEKEATIRLVGKHCRGAGYFTVPQRIALWQALRKEVERGETDPMRKTLAALLGMLKDKGANVSGLPEDPGPDADVKMLFDLTGRTIDLRVGCGADFNDVILSEPLDGKDHVAKCPECGLVIRYRPPNLDG